MFPNSREEYLYYSTIYNFLHLEDKKYWLNGRNEESIQATFNSILGMTISELHDKKHISTHNPFMIAMTYIHRFIRLHLLNKTGSANRSVFFPHTKIGFQYILSELRRNTLAMSPLSGVVYISDRKVTNTEWFGKLRLYKAFPIGQEILDAEHSDKLNGASFFVARKMVVFALNYHYHQRQKENAQYHQLFTLSIAYTLEKNQVCTITTRTFSDLKSVGTAMSSTRADTKMTTIVVVVLGYSDYHTDKVLYNLGKKLSELGYVLFYFFYCKIKKDVLMLDSVMGDEVKWQKMYDEKAVLQKFRTDRETSSNPWSFILSSIDSIIHFVDNDMAIQPVIMTIPLNVTMKRTNDNPIVGQQDKGEGKPESAPEKTSEEKPQGHLPNELNGTSEEAQIKGQRAETQAHQTTDKPKDVPEIRRYSEIDSSTVELNPQIDGLDEIPEVSRRQLSRTDRITNVLGARNRLAINQQTSSPGNRTFSKSEGEIDRLSINEQDSKPDKKLERKSMSVLEDKLSFSKTTQNEGHSATDKSKDENLETEGKSEIKSCEPETKLEFKLKAEQITEHVQVAEPKIKPEAEPVTQLAGSNTKKKPERESMNATTNKPPHNSTGNTRTNRPPGGTRRSTLSNTMNKSKSTSISESRKPSEVSPVIKPISTLENKSTRMDVFERLSMSNSERKAEKRPGGKLDPKSMSTAMNKHNRLSESMLESSSKSRPRSNLGRNLRDKSMNRSIIVAEVKLETVSGNGSMSKSETVGRQEEGPESILENNPKSRTESINRPVIEAEFQPQEVPENESMSKSKAVGRQDEGPKSKLENNPTRRTASRPKSKSTSRPTSKIVDNKVSRMDSIQDEKKSEEKGSSRPLLKTGGEQQKIKPESGQQSSSTVQKKRSIQITRKSEDGSELLYFGELIVQLLGTL